MDAAGAISIPEQLYQALVAEMQARLPDKSFGYLISDVDPLAPTDFLFFEDNRRNDQEWRGEFESYGDYYVLHPDAGFVVSPEEALRRQREIWARDMFEIGVFHSHHRHPANFSRIDYEMHVQRFDDLWHLVVSLRNPTMPVARAFATSDRGVQELPIHLTNSASAADGAVAGPDDPRPPIPKPADREQLVARARLVLRVDRQGRPRWGDPSAVLATVDGILDLGDAELEEHLLRRGLLRHADERFHQHVAPDMQPLGPVSFEMGSSSVRPDRVFGEIPRHRVELSPFAIGRLAVTNQLYSLFDPRRGELPSARRRQPVTDLTWAEASLFALWMGCRLPTEAEWEYACGAGSADEWCCPSQDQLPEHAWYCKNSGGDLHPVGTRQPNGLGLFDCHGNVWEWCQDRYDSRFYERAPRRDPVCDPAGSAPGGRVTRGGSVHGHADMCRTRYRSHEPAGFHAADLGLRLARSPGLKEGGTSRW